MNRDSGSSGEGLAAHGRARSAPRAGDGDGVGGSGRRAGRRRSPPSLAVVALLTAVGTAGASLLLAVPPSSTPVDLPLSREARLLTAGAGLLSALGLAVVAARFGAHRAAKPLETSLADEKRRGRERSAALAGIRSRHDLLPLLSRGSPLPGLLEAVARSVQEEMGEPGCSVLVAGEGDGRLAVGGTSGVPEEVARIFEGAELGPDREAWGRVAFTGERTAGPVPGSEGAFWGEPVPSSTGTPLGVLGVHAREGWSPSPEQAESLEEAARFVGYLLEHSRVQGELVRLSRAVEHGPAPIVITEADGTIVYVNGRFSALTGYSAGELLGRNPRILKSGRTPPETYREMWSALSAGREWRGELVNARKGGEVYWELASVSPLRDPTGRVSHYVGVKEDISAIKETEQQLRLLSQTDPLTGLLNRRGFFASGEQHLRVADRLGQPVRLLYVDVDGLKFVNDAFGHAEGDRALREAGILLTQTMRSSDVLGRVGGDEFAVLVIETGAGVEERLENRLQEKLASLNRRSVRPWTLSLSIGAAVRPPRAGTSLETFLAEADRTMYGRKRTRQTEVGIA